MTNAEKKAILSQYRWAEKRIARLIEEKAAWMAKATAVTPVYSDMPKGGGDGDRVPTAVERIVEIERELDREIDRQTDLRARVEAAIRGLSDKRLQDILCRRFIDGDRLEKVAVDLTLDYRWVRRLQERAIQKLTLESPPPPVI